MLAPTAELGLPGSGRSGVRSTQPFRRVRERTIPTRLGSFRPPPALHSEPAPQPALAGVELIDAGDFAVEIREDHRLRTD